MAPTYVTIKVEAKDGEKDAPEKQYGEICVMFELLLNYLTAISYQKNAENDKEGYERVHKLINSLKASLLIYVMFINVKLVRGIWSVLKRKDSRRLLQQISISFMKNS